MGAIPLIRAGTPMFDGFDDSSTFMSGEIAAVFALYYPSTGLDCAEIWSLPLEEQLHHFDWLSWGNSWMARHCSWRQRLKERFNLTLVEPSIDCFTGKYIYDGDPSGGHPIEAYNFTAVEKLASTSLNFPCGDDFCNRNFYDV